MARQIRTTQASGWIPKPVPLQSLMAELTAIVILITNSIIFIPITWCRKQCTIQVSEYFFPGNFSSIADNTQTEVWQDPGNFVHRPLLTQYEFSFRLLILYPGKAGSPLHGQLITKEFDKQDTNQRYQALSYVWGRQASRSITLFGKRFPIYRNTYEALQGIRNETSARAIWVDAICIDQANATERAQQVAMMEDIYKCACNVINWLGPSTRNSDFGLKFLAVLFGEDDLASDPPWKRHGASIIRKGLNDILDRAYFQRVWVVQENALANKITLKVGQWELTLNKGADIYRAICRIKFAAISASWEEAGLQDINFSPLLEILDQSMMINRRAVGRPCREVTMLDTMYDMRRRKSTDRRDMLFAWRSLAPEEIRESFVVDYSKSADELYGELFEEVKKAYMKEMELINFPLIQSAREARYWNSAGW